jgi:hypothetical protein
MTAGSTVRHLRTTLQSSVTGPTAVLGEVGVQVCEHVTV